MFAQVITLFAVLIIILFLNLEDWDMILKENCNLSKILLRDTLSREMYGINLTLINSKHYQKFCIILYVVKLITKI
jgi:hypothetical protein